MFAILEWVLILIQVVPYIVMAASVITALTPTPADDKWVAKAYKVLEYCALVIGKAKQLAPKAEKKDTK